MKINPELQKKYAAPKKSQFLHSPDHVLADELSTKLGDQKRFGFYLKAAVKCDHNLLRKILGAVLEGKARKPGALFAFLLKKENQQLKAEKSGKE